MKQGKKIACIVAGCMTVFGGLMGVATAAATHFDVAKLSRERFTESSYVWDDSFFVLHVEADCDDVQILPSDNDQCRVVCPESEKVSYRLEQVDDTLYVRRVDSRRWYDMIGFFWRPEGSKVKVYLPVLKGVYGDSSRASLQVKTTSGNIEVAAEGNFREQELRSSSGSITVDHSGISHMEISVGDSSCVTAETTSGDIAIRRLRGGTLSATSTSGDVEVDEVNYEEIHLASTSGDIKAQKIGSSCDSLSVTTTSGDIEMQDISTQDCTLYSVSGEISCAGIEYNSGNLETTSGDIELQDILGHLLYIKSVSGDVDCTFRTNLYIDAYSVSGKIYTHNLGQSSGSHECYIETTSGDITAIVQAGA